MEPVFAWDPDPDCAQLTAQNHDVLVADRMPDPREIPHPEVVTLVPPPGRFAPALASIRDLGPRMVVSQVPAGDEATLAAVLRKLGYKSWAETLDARHFGVPQRRPRRFLVAVREDARGYSEYFPFPDDGRPTPLGKALDPAPDRSLYLTPERFRAVMARNERNRENGTGFRFKVVGAGDVAPTLTTRLAKEGREFLVRDEGGVRDASMAETLAIMGFPRDYATLSRTATRAAIAKDTCPPVMAAILVELAEWLGRPA